MLWFLTQQFVLVLITAIAFGVFGWWLRPKFEKVGATRAEVDAERGKNQTLEERARKAEAEAKAATSELASLKGSSVSRSELDAAKKAVAEEQAKSESLQVQLKKARELQVASESRNNDAGKSTLGKVFALENEVASLREQAARDRQAAADALGQVEHLKASAPGKPEEMSALETELMQARRAFTASENAASEASRERDKSNVEATKMRDKLKVLEGELAIARGNAKPGAAASAENDAGGLRISLAAAESKAAEAMRSISIARDEAFALRSKVGLLEAELSEAKSSIQAPATEGDIEHVRDSWHASQAEADTAKQAYSTAASQIIVMRTEISALKAQIDKLHAQHGTVAADERRITTSPSAPPQAPTVAEAAAEMPAAAADAEEPVNPAPDSEADLPPVA
ncbi:MAG: hypothetical protein JWO94_2319 [Verrucomicrobiaceae bacterium]|nr:hypothetical protein [Verrucomicrobiaceae bacterium]